jgi:hypothetical protein
VDTPTVFSRGVAFKTWHLMVSYFRLFFAVRDNFGPVSLSFRFEYM